MASFQEKSIFPPAKWLNMVFAFCHCFCMCFHTLSVPLNFGMHDILGYSWGCFALTFPLLGSPNLCLVSFAHLRRVVSPCSRRSSSLPNGGRHATCQRARFFLQNRSVRKNRGRVGQTNDLIGFGIFMLFPEFARVIYIYICLLKKHRIHIGIRGEKKNKEHFRSQLFPFAELFKAIHVYEL